MPKMGWFGVVRSRHTWSIARVLGPLDHYRKDKELLERIQRRYTKMINDMNGKTYEDRLGLRCLRLWTLEDRIEVFKIYRGFSNISLHKLFILDTNGKGKPVGLLRGTHTCKLVKNLKTRCIRYITKYFVQAS